MSSIFVKAEEQIEFIRRNYSEKLTLTEQLILVRTSILLDELMEREYRGEL